MSHRIGRRTLLKTLGAGVLVASAGGPRAARAQG